MHLNLRLKVRAILCCHEKIKADDELNPLPLNNPALNSAHGYGKSNRLARKHLILHRLNFH